MAIPNPRVCLGNAALALKQAGEREGSPDTMRAFAAVAEAWCYLAQTQHDVGVEDTLNPMDAARWEPPIHIPEDTVTVP